MYLRLTHATLKNPLDVNMTKVSFIYKSKDESTHIVFEEKQMIMVDESPDQIMELLKQGAPNGTSKQ